MGYVFLDNPHPEKLVQLTLPMNGEIEVFSSLCVGVKIRTHDNSGLRLSRPVKEVFIEIQNSSGTSEFSLPAEHAQQFVPRLEEFVKACLAPISEEPCING